MPSLSDSIVKIAENDSECPTCGAYVLVNHDSCVGCLLRAGLDGAAEENVDDFNAVLREIEIRDVDWRLGNYQILGEIGRGGMGVIYRAQQRHSKRIVALKRVLSYHGDSRDTLERFRREAEAAASLDHPNILPIYEVSESEGLPFFTMKFAPRGSLQQAASALSAEPRECVRLLAKVARAVAYAHCAGILHRDLKPGNILLDARGEPLVSDFGLAKWIDTTNDFTRSLAIFGTPGFIAPEQASGSRAELTPAADVYSLGAILFDLLTGQPPFMGEHAIAVIRQAAETSAPKLRSLLPKADRDLETICARCLEREPALRYRSASDLADDLDRWFDGRAILARPVLPPVRLWRWSKRNPILAAVIALALLITGTAVTRQIQSWRLEKQIAAQIAAQHSILVLPFLDLDRARLAPEWTRTLAAQFETEMTSRGPATILVSDSPAPGKAAAARPARALLAGTTRTVAGRVRVSLYLLAANTRAPLLHRTVSSANVAELASLSAEALATEAYRALSSSDLNSVARPITDPGLMDPEARNFLEAGIELAYRRSGADLDRSVSCLEHALELQPKSSAIYAALAKTISFQSAYGGTDTSLPRAQELARTAVALDDESAEAHLALAAAFGRMGRSQESIEETLTYFECSPTSRRGANLLINIYKSIGRPDRALAWYAVGKESERTPGEADPGMADCFLQRGEIAQAEALYQRASKLHPEQPDGWVGLAHLRLLDGRIEEARAMAARESKGYADFSYTGQMTALIEFFGRNYQPAEKLYLQLSETNSEGGGNFYGDVSFLSALGYLQARRGDAAASDSLARAQQMELQALETSPEDPSVRYRLAAIHSILGEREKALSLLQAAFEAGWIDHRSLALDPRFDAVRDDPRYAEVIAGMKQRVATLRQQAHDFLTPR